MNPDLLRNVPLFASLSDSALTVLAGRMRRRHMPANTPVVYRGDPGDALYIIVTGRVKVHTATLGGDEVILEILKSGDFFGDMSLLDGQPRAADVTTIEPTELALLDGDALQQAIREQPGIALSLLRILSQRLREQNEKTVTLGTRDVTGRVATHLLHLADTQGQPLPNGAVRIEAKQSQSDIAASVGATRERVSRVLTAFRAQKLILWDKSAGRWVVCNRVGLARRAEMS